MSVIGPIYGRYRDRQINLCTPYNLPSKYLRILSRVYRVAALDIVGHLLGRQVPGGLLNAARSGGELSAQCGFRHSVEPRCEDSLSPLRSRAQRPEQASKRCRFEFR